MLNILEILTFINIATANKKLDIKQKIKYLLNSNLPSLLTANITLDTTIIIAPNIFLNANCSLKNTNPKITKNTVDNCLSILKLEGLNPYLASIFNLSVTAYIIVTTNKVIYTLISLGNVYLKKIDITIANKPVNSSNNTVNADAFFIVLFTFLKPCEKINAKTK